MITNERQARNFIQSKRDAGIVYSLDRIEALMEALDHPEEKIKAIHVAGTNGKGSTCAFISSIYREAGYEVGAFNTPVFGAEKDQITRNENPIVTEDFVMVCQKVEPLVKGVEKRRDEKISEFECMVAITYYYFAYVRPVDVVLIEAGMGGRLDATNILPFPIATAVSNVGLDHQQFLGETLREIAKEKAGVIKKGVPHFTACKGEALEIMKQTAKENETTVFSVFDEIKIETMQFSDNQIFTYKKADEEATSYTMQLVGDHQTINASLALAIVEGIIDILPVSEGHKVHGLRQAFVPGRWERIANNPTIILDTAHNVEAIDTVCKLIENTYVNSDVTLLFAAMKDKPIQKMVEKLSSVDASLYLASFSSPRAMTIRDYEEMLPKNELNKKWVKDVPKWIQSWRELANQNNVLIITGSHYFIGECRSYLI
ncbi:bifunctional folylpolyglutamate synthase/dihydrofolate synthase [Salipaludibacillus daqingensis]|uniref:bifunctional folylpolyglutamate synthase/dihydrofolate synthase n=1 Tax=Salipaludibacillus daqingensis TaxID=3041001 RepID=UPI0024749A0A|nr:folylpolyglutamate synthase/dihydrofolate synthase family protein [Salipaludibacillus daqingensis]